MSDLILYPWPVGGRDILKPQWRDILKHWLRQNAHAWPGWEGTTSLMNTPGSESPGTWLPHNEIHQSTFRCLAALYGHLHYEIVALVSLFRRLETLSFSFFCWWLHRAWKARAQRFFLRVGRGSMGRSGLRFGRWWWSDILKTLTIGFA